MAINKQLSNVFSGPAEPVYALPLQTGRSRSVVPLESPMDLPLGSLIKLFLGHSKDGQGSEAFICRH